jgi:hypothetical protein
MNEQEGWAGCRDGEDPGRGVTSMGAGRGAEVQSTLDAMQRHGCQLQRHILISERQPPQSLAVQRRTLPAPSIILLLEVPVHAPATARYNLSS